MNKKKTNRSLEKIALFADLSLLPVIHLSVSHTAICRASGITSHKPWGLSQLVLRSENGAVYILQ